MKTEEIDGGIKILYSYVRIQQTCDIYHMIFKGIKT